MILRAIQTACIVLNEFCLHTRKKRIFFQTLGLLIVLTIMILMGNELVKVDIMGTFGFLLITCQTPTTAFAIKINRITKGSTNAVNESSCSSKRANT